MEEKPKPRRFQFSLRTMFVLLTVAAVVAALMTYKARQQRLAVRAIYAAGGSVMYQPIDEHWPNWLVKIGGIHYFTNVVAVDLHDMPITDTLVERLKSLTKLKRIEVSFAREKDADIRRLEQELPDYMWCLYPSPTKATVKK